MLDNVEVLEPAAVLPRVHEMADTGYRYVTITCCTNPDGTYDLFYAFDKDYRMVTLKTTLQPEEAIPSISGVYLAGAFAENEISELFGVEIDGKAIDYGGRFVLSEGSPESPFGKGVILVKKEGAPHA